MPDSTPTPDPDRHQANPADPAEVERREERHERTNEEQFLSPESAIRSSDMSDAVEEDTSEREPETDPDAV